MNSSFHITPTFMIWRCDRGKPRTVAQEIIDKAIEIKRDQPERSHHAINLFGSFPF